MERTIIDLLEGALASSKMELADFGKIFLEDKDLPYPKTEKEVTEFIKKRTELYRKSWLINPLKEALRKLKGA
ncbi:hypothetical protein KAR91_74925 [Candidatus Pacearchaeota archaeon]|nr:hypothetical protein [Candidatus Pacearchaeota archaeon]